MTELPERVSTEAELDELLSRPSPRLVEMMRGLSDDLVVLGAAGKIGITLCRMAVRALAAAGVRRQVIAVGRFSDPAARALLEDYGARPVTCDLLDRAAVAALPRTENVIFLAGRKFGTEGAVETTWAMNTLVPHNCAEHYAGSRIVAFSTGCVYPLATAASGGCSEETPPAPIGEYAQSSLARERIFGHYSQTRGTRVCLFRLNYAVELRYGVLFDIGSQIWNGKPVDNNVGQLNCLWQGDVNNIALLSLQECRSPYSILNVTGPEILSTRYVAEALGRLMNKPVQYQCAQESPVAYLNNASRAMERFGYPSVSPLTLLQWTAHWLMAGGRSLGKPTHFEVSNGKF